MVAYNADKFLRYNNIHKLYMLNEYCYRTLISPWIPLEDRQVLTKKEMYIHALRLSTEYTRQSVLSNVSLHMGVPCSRYCICSYFNIDDILDYYERTRSTSEH